MSRVHLKNALVLGIALALACLGAYNIFLKATFSLPDDGVFWKDATEGVLAARVAPGGPGDLAGIEPGDLLLGLDGEPVTDALQVEERLQAKPAGSRPEYSLLRVGERRSLRVSVEPLGQGNVTLFYYLSLVGFFSLAVGTIVMLRRPPDAAAIHFFAICLLFFLMYSTSYTGKLDAADWTLLWTDHLAILFLPVAFLHFCLSFPERRLPRARAWLVPAAYAPAVGLAGVAVFSQVMFVQSGGQNDLLWHVTAAIDRWKPLYFAVGFALSFAVLLDSYTQTKSLTARKQMKWLVLGTGAGVLPFFAFYALPFALGREPRAAGELAGYIPLALIPLSLAYAVVKHRLMDVELIFRRSLVYVLATAAIVGISLLSLGLMGSLFGDEEPHEPGIAILTTLVVILLFTPVKSRIQVAIDKLFFRERYLSRRALLRLSQDLNADLDLGRMTERLLDGVVAALGVDSAAVFLPGEDGHFVIFRRKGALPAERADALRLPPQGALVRRLQDGTPLNADTAAEAFPEAGGLDLSYYFPCRVGGELIAVVAVGRKDGFDPLNSEEVDLVQALSGQAATAFMNGRLFGRLREKADDLQRLTEYNVAVLESIDAGIVVLDLEGRIARWNRAMERLVGRRRGDALGRALDEIFPGPFLEALKGSLALGDSEEISNIYKLHLPSADGRALLVNVSVAPFLVEGRQRAGTVLILDDVTARFRLEEQLQHSEKMASIGLLAAGVAHEVNTPLTGISSYTQMLRQQTPDGDPRGEMLEKIEKQTFRAAKIINSLLNFSRSAPSDYERIDLNKLLADVLSLLEHQLERSKVRVRRELGEGLPLVRGHENKLQQVFFNLILNAKDAMPAGGWLTLVSYADEDTVVVEVRDTGHGIKPEDVKRIYDPFFTTKGIGRGTGLGLAVSYGILQEHGGAIFVESAPGKGTTFQVALPALAAVEAARG
ncbi:MAG: ATP-binding protein [Vicinamibacteria bacterium]|nr:ATP-binding protein [Vicinamibacteria bacterium]